jgi:transposase
MTGATAMEVLYPRCSGLDVHKRFLVACLSIVQTNGQRQKELRQFTTMTSEILALKEWLQASGCRQIAMESSGVYWKPVFHLLEGEFEIVLVNAQHMKAVPGRKTDVKDAEWIADLLQHGLLKASFIPTSRATGCARSDSEPDDLVAGTQPPGQSHPQSARGCQPQTRIGGD